MVEEQRAGQQEYTISTDEGQKASGRTDIKIWKKEEAIPKAVKGLAICWGLAIATIFIPIVHFFSVPILLLVGPGVAFGMYRMYNGRREISSDGVVCPKCQTALTLPSSPENYPHYEECPGCQVRLTVELTS